MKTLIIIFALLLSVTAYSQVPIDLQQATNKAAVDSNYITLVSDPTSGNPYKATVGRLFNTSIKTLNDSFNIVGTGNLAIAHGPINYASATATASNIPQGTWKIFKNTATDSIFLYLNDSTTIYRIHLSKFD